MRKEVTQKDAGYKHMPETIFATPKKTWSWYEVVVDCSGNPTNNRKAHPRYRYVRADLISKDYIRRAVTKEEAGEAEIDFNNDPAVLYLLEPSTVQTIRKLLEAHK